MNILLMSYGKSYSFTENFYNFLKKINQNQINIYGVDLYPPKSLERCFKKSFKVPKVTSKKYLTFILKILNLFKINYIIPFNDFDLKFISRNYDLLKKKVKILAPPKKEILKCSDKIATKSFLKNIGLNSPELFNKNDIKNLKRKLILKQRGKKNFKTKGFYKINDSRYIKNHLKRLNNDYLIEEFIEGQEYTVDVLANNKSSIIVLPRKRLKTKNYISIKGKVVSDKNIENQAKKISKELKIIGFANFQCFVEKKTKKIIWHDLNPRISGGIDIFIQAYPDLFKNLLQLLNGNKYFRNYGFKKNKKEFFNRNII